MRRSHPAKWRRQFEDRPDMFTINSAALVSQFGELASVMLTPARVNSTCCKTSPSARVRIDQAWLKHSTGPRPRATAKCRVAAFEQHSCALADEGIPDNAPTGRDLSSRTCRMQSRCTWQRVEQRLAHNLEHWVLLSRPGCIFVTASAREAVSQQSVDASGSCMLAQLHFAPATTAPRAGGCHRAQLLSNDLPVLSHSDYTYLAYPAPWLVAGCRWSSMACACLQPEMLQVDSAS